MCIRDSNASGQIGRHKQTLVKMINILGTQHTGKVRSHSISAVITIRCVYETDQKENAALQASSALWQLYEEAKNLHASIEEYERTFHQQQDLSLLKQALMGGQISMIEYFVEISVVYQSRCV